MKIVITGSLGNISKPLAQQLVLKQHNVTVISSNANKQQAIEALGATAAIGQLEDTVFLTNTFKHADAVYCMVPLSFTEADQKGYRNKISNAYKEAIQNAGVPRAVFLTGWAVDFIEDDTVETLRAQLPDTTISELRPASFYSNFYGMIPMIQQNNALFSIYGGDDLLAWVAPEDIAVAAFEALTTEQEPQKIRYVASEELTCNEVARILGEAIGKPYLQWIAIPEEQAMNGLLSMGAPADLAQDLVRMQAAQHSGAVYENYLQHRPILGNKKLTTFAKEFAAAYNAS